MTSVRQPRGTQAPGVDHLSADRVRATVVALQERVSARFPRHHLAAVAGQLTGMVDQVSQHTRDKHLRVARATVAARTVAAVALLLAVGVLTLALSAVLAQRPGDVTTWIPLVESVINTAVFIAIAFLFLWAFPERRERKGLLALLHQLRSLAHVLDMHHIGLGPEQTAPDVSGAPQGDPAPGELTPTQLYAYLGYCTELFSLIATCGALCAERSSDSTVLQTVSDVETLTTELSGTVYRKMELLTRSLHP